MSELNDLILEKMEELNNFPFEDVEKMYFLEKFLKDFKITDYESYVKCNSVYYLEALLIARGIEIDVKDFMEKASEFVGIFSEQDYDPKTYLDYLNILEQISNESDELKKKELYRKLKSLAKEIFIDVDEEKEEEFYNLKAEKKL